MKQVKDYIFEYKCNDTLDIIDSKINYEYINESLQSNIIMDLVRQITNLRAEQKKVDSWHVTPLFKQMFRWYHVAWDKITDEDFEISKYLSDDETDKKAIKARKEIEKQVRSHMKSSVNALVFLRDPKTNKFKYYLDEYGSIYDVVSGSRLTSGRGNKDITQSDRMDYVQKNDIYYLPLAKFSTTDKRRNRGNAQNGMIEMDDKSLRKIAEDNVTRYKEIIAKNKSKKMAENDTIAEEVQEIVNRVLDLTVRYNKDIVKYAGLAYEMDALMKLVYDQRVHTSYSKGKPQYTGKFGLLYFFAQYMSNKKSAVANNNSYSSMDGYYNKQMTSYKDAIEELFEKIDSKINDIESKM